MTAPIGGAAPGAAAPGTEAERLRKVARDLEGVFVEQMFKAMRETVPEGGVVDGGSGEAMFTGLLDQRLSAEAPARWEHGLAEVLYRQLAGRLPAAPPAAPPAGPAVPSAVADPHSSIPPAGPILPTWATPTTDRT
jgi:flagellar protein FlgJ